MKKIFVSMCMLVMIFFIACAPGEQKGTPTVEREIELVKVFDFSNVKINGTRGYIPISYSLANDSDLKVMEKILQIMSAFEEEKKVRINQYHVQTQGTAGERVIGVWISFEGNVPQPLRHVFLHDTILWQKNMLVRPKFEFLVQLMYNRSDSTCTLNIPPQLSGKAPKVYVTYEYNLIGSEKWEKDYEKSHTDSINFETGNKIHVAGEISAKRLWNDVMYFTKCRVYTKEKGKENVLATMMFSPNKANTAFNKIQKIVVDDQEIMK